MKKGNQMKDKELYERISQLEGYPIDYQSNLSTQQKLIEDSVNTSNSNIQNSYTYKYISIVAAILVVFVSIAVYFSVNIIKKESKHLAQIQSIPSKAIVDEPMLNAKSYPQKGASNYNVVEVLDTNSLNIDTNKTIVFQSPIIAIKADTIVPQKESAMKEQPKLFAKRQRIKQFDFESNVNPLPAEASRKKMEYFVLKDGQFKIFSRNKNQININHF
jgi:hypothetical protein